MTNEEFAKINVLSDLLQVAIDDYKKLDRDDYVPDSFVYHGKILDLHSSFSKDDVGKCHVCFAGAVIAGTIGEGLDTFICPVNYDTDTHSRLLALDLARAGQFHEAWMHINRVSECPGYVDDLLSKVSDKYDSRWSMFEGWEDGDKFVEEMDKVVDELKSVGL